MTNFYDYPLSNQYLYYIGKAYEVTDNPSVSDLIDVIEEVTEKPFDRELFYRMLESYQRAIGIK